MEKDLTISIVTYNHERYILNCLDSIYSNKEGLDIHVCVVDNNSEDNTVNLVRSNYPKVQLIRNKKNVGFAKANNQVMRDMKARYCLITNPDVIVLPDTLKTMVDFMDSNPDAGASGCKILNRDQTLQYSCRRYPTLMTLISRAIFLDVLFPRNKMIEKYLMKDSTHDKIINVDWVTGCCLMVRKEAAKEVGLFDENYTLYLEDVDLCYRISKKWKVYYIPNVSMIHEFRQGSRKIINLKERLYHVKSAIHYIRKYGTSP